MPAGVSWGRYIRFGIAAMMSMMAGAQCVHALYRPMDDLPELIDEFYREHPEMERKKLDPYQETLELNIKQKLKEKGKIE